MSKAEIFPTAVPKDENDLKECARFVSTFSKNLHIDADDGIFTPITCWPYTAGGILEEFDLSSVQALETEVHLMVQDPREIGRKFARAGARAVFGHVETFTDAEDARQTLESWRREGAREVGMAILLDTPVEALGPFVSLCDFVCFMSSAQIGSQGAQFDFRVLERIRTTHDLYPDLQIEVDIGVSEKTIDSLVQAGVTRFAVGSAITRADDPAAVYNRLLELANTV